MGRPGRASPGRRRRKEALTKAKIRSVTRTSNLRPTYHACARVAVFRKCFDLREIRASASEMVLDFGNVLADRRYTF